MRDERVNREQGRTLADHRGGVDGGGPDPLGVVPDGGREIVIVGPVGPAGRRPLNVLDVEAIR